MLIIPTTTLETKKAPPKTQLRPTRFVVVAPVKDTMLENTSGAPLPRERRVTPAIVGESLKSLDKPSKFEQKYMAAVLPRR